MINKVLVSEDKDVFVVKDVVNGDFLPMDSTTTTFEVNEMIANIIKNALIDGKCVKIMKNKLNIVRIIDLIIEDLNELELKRKVALNAIQDTIGKGIFAVSLIDSFDFLNSYMKLINKGITITDENREDVYFQIIEKAQEAEEPEPLKENSTFEDEQKFIEQKKAYDNAQDTLKTLEYYLNGYDKLRKINFVNDILQESRDKIQHSDSIEEIENINNEYTEKIVNLFYKNTR